MTLQLDVTEFRRALPDARRKTYPAQIWAIATVVNRHDEFRMAVDDLGRPAVWETVHPAFTVFNPERETFAAVWTPYDPDFSPFHERVVDLLREHRSATSMFPQGDLPEDVFDISSLPWMHFTGFNLDIVEGHRHYLPIVTLGRFDERDGRTHMPIAVQIHHAVADGFHVARLARELQDLLSRPDWLC